MYAVRMVGIVIELNPIARFLIGNGYGGIAKVIVVPIVLTIVGITVRLERRLAWAVYAVLIFYIVVVINNFVVLWRI
jgi:uncharacterized membrane protein